MKYKKWLPIVVAILFLINLAAFIVFRVIDVDLVVRDKMTARLERSLEADVTMEGLTLDDRQMNITGLTFDWKARNMRLSIEQVYISYKMRRLLFSGFKIPGVVQQVSIYNPRFDFIIDGNKPVGEDEELSIADILANIPDLSGYFKSLILENGTVCYQYLSDEVTARDTIGKIRVDAQNDELCRVGIVAGDSLFSLTGSIVMQKGTFLNADVSIKGYRPDQVDISVLDTLDFRLDSRLHLTEHSLDIDGNLRDVAVDYQGQTVRAGSIGFTGTNDSLSVHSYDIAINGDTVRSEIVVFKPFEQERTLNGTYSGTIDASHYIPELDGYLGIKGRLNGDAERVNLFADVTSDSLTYGKFSLKNILVDLGMSSDGIHFLVHRMSLWDNPIDGEGFWSFSNKLNMRLNARAFAYEYENTRLTGDVASKLVYSSGKPLKLNAEIAKLSAENEYVNFTDMHAELALAGSILEARIVDSKEHLEINLDADIALEKVESNFHFRRFDLNDYLPLNSSATNFPSINGNIDISADRNNVQLDSRLRVYEERYGMLDGFLITNAAIDLLHERTYLHIRTRSGVYNFEPVQFHLLAAGSLDSLHTLDCRLNENVGIELRMKLEPSFDLGFRIKGRGVDIPEYLEYFMNYYMTRKFEGEADFDFAYNMGDKDRVRGWLTLKDFRYEDSRPLSTMLRFDGTKDGVAIEPFQIAAVGHPVASGEANVLLGPRPSVDVSLDIDELNLQDLFESPGHQGILAGSVKCRFREDDDYIQTKLSARKLNYGGFQADSLYVDATQDNHRLRIDTLYAGHAPYYSLSARGAIGYNFLREKAFDDSSTVSVRFDGDFLKMLSDRFSFFHHGESNAHMDLTVGLRNEQLNIETGEIRLKDGSIKPDYFNTRIRDIQIDMQIENNILDIREFSLGTEGAGRLHIENGDIGAEDQFVLGTLQMGYIYAYTDPEGIWASIPWYMPENTLANAVIKGRYEDRAVVTGPFDDIHILGDVYASNGGAIYPEDVTSLLDIVGTETSSWLNDKVLMRKRKNTEEERRHSPYVRIGVPISMDLMVHFTDNCFYVMNPCNFLVNPDSFLHLIFWDRYIFVKEAMFTSEQGTMDLFGSTFQVDYVEVVVNQYMDKKGEEILGLSDYDVKIKASLYNKTADGTLITLDVVPQNQDMKNIIGNLQFQLSSDDSNDQTVMSMLSKLKYGRSHDEVTPQQQEALFQDEALYMAGAGVENIYVNPILSPIENTLRKFLHLDYFYIRPGIFRNLFYEYAGSHINEPEPVEEESGMARFSGILLNDLSVRLGKYLTRNLFVDYEFLVEKTTDIERTRMSLSHDFTVRYDLPWRFQLGYTYRLEDDIHHQVHQIMLEKSLRF